MFKSNKERRVGEMDKLKGIFNSITGSDGKLDADDLKNIDVNDLKAQAESLGLGDLAAEADQLGIGNLDIAALGSLNFPLDKAGIVSAVKSAGVSDSLVGLLDKIPDQVYDTLQDLQKKLLG